MSVNVPLTYTQERSPTQLDNNFIYIPGSIAISLNGN